jgi:hypothetical protein
MPPSVDPSPFSREDSREDASADSRAERIARVAYFRAQQRGFEPGLELEDWLAAEREVDGAADSPGAARPV